MRTIPSLVLIVFGAFGQPAVTPAATFDVASIKPSVSESGRESIEVSPGSLIMRHVRLIACIKWAYQVEEYQISGPGWLTAERFDLAAKAPGAAPEQELRRMLQALLAERFKLELHRVTKQLPAYALSVGKTGHKMRPSDGDGPMSFTPNGPLSVAVRYAVVSEVAAMASQRLRAPVIDLTGLTGKFDFTFNAAPYITDELQKRGPGAEGRPSEPDLISIAMIALPEQLGLRLESKKVPVEILVIDGIERAPTEN